MQDPKGRCLIKLDIDDHADKPSLLKVGVNRQSTGCPVSYKKAARDCMA